MSFVEGCPRLAYLCVGASRGGLQEVDLRSSSAASKHGSGCNTSNVFAGGERSNGPLVVWVRVWVRVLVDFYRDVLPVLMFQINVARAIGSLSRGSAIVEVEEGRGAPPCRLHPE